MRAKTYYTTEVTRYENGRIVESIGGNSSSSIADECFVKVVLASEYAELEKEYDILGEENTDLMDAMNALQIAFNDLKGQDLPMEPGPDSEYRSVTFSTKDKVRYCPTRGTHVRDVFITGDKLIIIYGKTNPLDAVMKERDELRERVAELEKDVARYHLIRGVTAPRLLYERLLWMGRVSESWQNVREDQTLSSKIDELCDTAIAAGKSRDDWWKKEK